MTRAETGKELIWKSYFDKWKKQGRTKEQIWAVENFMTGQGQLMLKELLKKQKEETQTKINMICLGIETFKESERERTKEEKRGLRRRDGGPYMAAFSLIDRILNELKNI